MNFENFGEKNVFVQSNGQKLCFSSVRLWKAPFILQHNHLLLHSRIDFCVHLKEKKKSNFLFNSLVCYRSQCSLHRLRNDFTEVGDEGTGEQLRPCKHLPLILPGDRPRVSTPAASWAREEMRGGGGEGSGRLTKRDRVRGDRGEAQHTMRDQRRRLCTAAAKTSTSVAGLLVKVVVFRFS